MKQSFDVFIPNCPICGNNGFEKYLKTKDYFLTNEEFNLFRCKDCGYIFTYPIPSPNEISKYYNSQDYFSHQSNKQNLTRFFYDKIRKINIKNKYQLVNFYKKEGSILDYGCGSGNLLNYFKNKGWKIAGYEPNENARNAASLLTNSQIFDEIGIHLNQQRFDVITLWHVLEHIPNLNETLDLLKCLLENDGILIIAVPNIQSPDAIHYEKFWAGLDVPRHLSHFSKQTINQFLQKHFLEIIDILPMKFDSFYVSLLSEKYKGNKFPYFSAFLNGMTSNMSAKRNNNFSSMIFVAKQK